MKLYDNDEYREDFMALVYDLLYNDGTNDRANQIIDAFDMAPAVEAEPLTPNAPITLAELRDMNGEAVFLKRPGYCDRWALVMVCPEVNTPFFLFHLGGVVLAKLELEQGAKAYRRKPEDQKT